MLYSQDTKKKSRFLTHSGTHWLCELMQVKRLLNEFECYVSMCLKKDEFYL